MARLSWLDEILKSYWLIAECSSVLIHRGFFTEIS